MIIVPMVSFIAVCIMEENGKMENGYAGRSYRKGFEFMTDDVVGRDCPRGGGPDGYLIQGYQASKVVKMPVVMGSGESSHFVCTRLSDMLFEADFNRKDISIFSSQLNKKVCNEHINVVDDGTILFQSRFCEL